MLHAIAAQARGLWREPAPVAALSRLPSYPWLVVFTACIGAFAGQVDASIVQLSLPALEHAFDAQLDQVTWVAIAYSLGFAAMLPVYARLAEMAGRKLMYLFGFALFGLFSAACGFVASLPLLILFRSLQGLSGALLGANSVVILVAAAGPERRGRAMGVFAAAQAIGISAGPALGGVLLGSLGWHWIFWVTVPFAAAGAVLAWLVVPLSKPISKDASFDLPGALMLIPALATLLLGITKLHAWGPLSLGVLVCAACALGLLVGFGRHERRVRAPLLNLGLFRSAAFAGGTLAVLLSYAMLYGMFFAMSFALARGYGDTPLTAGLRLTVVPIVLGLASPFAGMLAERRPHLVLLGGALLCAAAAVALDRLLTGTAGRLPGVTIALAVYGLGLGLFIAPNNTATLGAAPPEHAGQAGGLLNLMRAFGTAMGVASTSALLGWRLELASGVHERTLGVSREALLGAVGDVMLLLAAFAVVGGIASSLKAPDRK
jgi:EmrB/QacA subfamily drug resistance transporter